MVALHLTIQIKLLSLVFISCLDRDLKLAQQKQPITIQVSCYWSSFTSISGHHSFAFRCVIITSYLPLCRPRCVNKTPQRREARLTTCSLPDDEPVTSSCTSAANASPKRCLGWNGTHSSAQDGENRSSTNTCRYFFLAANLSAFQVVFH